MQIQTIKKPTCIVDFDNEQEIDEALLEAESGVFMSFEDFIADTLEINNNLFKNV